MSTKRSVLGRGLNALIPKATAPPISEGSLIDLDLDLLEPNHDQPRTEVDEGKLDELAQSIKASGVIQPILVRHQGGGTYEIIAGERRWRAAQRAGLLKVPVVVRDVPDNKRLELALIENIQRENLNPIEEARAYKRLADEFSLTQETIARTIGKDRATISNYQRLLTLPAEVQADVAAGTISMGHARALLSLPDGGAQRRASRDIQTRDLSVRETEAFVKKLLKPRVPSKPVFPEDVHTKAAEERLRVAIGTRVQIVRRANGGRIEIYYNSEDELQRLYEYLTER